jgi:hypothetical protein
MENMTNNRHVALANEARHFFSGGVLHSPALKFSEPLGFGSPSSCLLPVAYIKKCNTTQHTQNMAIKRQEHLVVW